MSMSFDMKTYSSKIRYSIPNNSKSSTLIYYVCWNLKQQIKTAHLPLFMPRRFIIFLTMYIMDLNNQNEKTMIDRIDKNNVNIKL